MVVVKGSSVPARGSLPASRPGMQPPARLPLEAFVQSEPPLAGSWSSRNPDPCGGTSGCT